MFQSKISVAHQQSDWNQIPVTVISGINVVGEAENQYLQEIELAGQLIIPICLAWTADTVATGTQKNTPWHISRRHIVHHHVPTNLVDGSIPRVLIVAILLWCDFTLASKSEGSSSSSASLKKRRQRPPCQNFSCSKQHGYTHIHEMQP